jgi:CrcB protein
VDLALVGAGGALGAIARYLVNRLAVEWFGPHFPYGTLFINLSGSFALGLLLTALAERAVLAPEYRLFFAVGFLGAYTTFSTWTYESAALLTEGATLAALFNLFGSLLLGMLAVFAGIACGRLFSH